MKITRKSILKLDKVEVAKVLEPIIWCSNEDLDKAMQFIGKEVVAWYALGVITDEQRAVLTKYKEYRKAKEVERLEKYLSEKMIVLEQELDWVNLFQCNKMLWRVIVASVKEESKWWITTKKANGDILEIYKDLTPKAYAYATSSYQEYVVE